MSDEGIGTDKIGGLPHDMTCVDDALAYLCPQDQPVSGMRIMQRTAEAMISTHCRVLELLLANFILEVGCKPSEAEVVVQHTLNGSSTWIRKREK